MATLRTATRLPIAGATTTTNAVRSFSTSTATQASKQAQGRAAAAKGKTKLKGKKAKKFAWYKMPELKDLKQYSLIDAMQYIRAFEVGQNPAIPKYDLAVRLRTKKDGPVLRNQIKLPWTVKSDIKVCVLVDPESKAGKQAKAAGASIIGLDDVFEQIKEGKIDFDRCLTTPEYLPAIGKAGLPRVLGPRGLMPNVKLGTVTENIGAGVSQLLGGSTYRERQGVVRMAVGQIGFTPQQLSDNIKVFLAKLKQEASSMTELQNVYKEIYEVVLSSTHSPGFSLNGQLKGEKSIKPQQLMAG